MSIPIATTTITVSRSNQDGTQDAYDGVTWRTVFRGVRAVIGSQSGSETNVAGSSQDMSARLNCDPITLGHNDRVTDDQTGETWQVETVTRRLAFGLDHVSANLRRITDRVSI